MSQQDKITLQSNINSQLADNTTGDISAADVRNNLINITDSLVFNNGDQAITGSLIVTGGITGSLQGTATTASSITSLSQNVVITGSLTQRNGDISLGVADTFGTRNINVIFSGPNEYITLGAGDSSSKPNRLQLYGPTGVAQLIAANDILLFSPTVTVSSSLLVEKGITGSLQGTSSYATVAQTLLGSVTSASYAITSSLSNETIGAGLYGGEIQFRGANSPGKNTYSAAFTYNYFTDGLNIGDPNSTGGNGAYYLAVGVESLANGNYSVAFGSGSLASGIGSFTHGKAITANGEYSHAEGLGTIASGSYQHVQGRFNTQGDSTSLMIVGNGTADGSRKDAFKVRISGSIVLPTTQSAAPSWTGTDGEMVFATVTGNHRFYVWMAGAWRSGSLA
jgi:hypothetical protein